MSIHRTAHEYSKDLYVDDITKQGLCWACYRREGKKTPSINKSAGLCREHYGKSERVYARPKEPKVVPRTKKILTRKCLDCDATWEVKGVGIGSKRRCLKCVKKLKQKRDRERKRKRGFEYRKLARNEETLT